MHPALQDVKYFLFDMDGTVYLGDRVFEGAPEFLASLRTRGYPFLFFTNNSSRHAVRYAEKLNRLGIPASPSDIITSGEATVDYLRSLAGIQRVFVLGTPSLEEEMTAAGLELDHAQPQAVVLGFDLTLTYE